MMKNGEQEAIVLLGHGKRERERERERVYV